MQSKTLLESRYRASIAQVDELMAIYRFIHAKSEVPAKDNILRAALTMLVSTIDTSIHELVVNAVLQELVEGKSKFNVDKQTVNIRCVLENDIQCRLALVENDLRKQLSKETFQSSRQIESVLSSIGIGKIWSRLSSKFAKSSEDIKIQLDLMVRRRNQIVHEADLDPTHNQQQITLEMLDELYAFSTCFIAGIFDEYENMKGFGV